MHHRLQFSLVLFVFYFLFKNKNSSFSFFLYILNTIIRRLHFIFHIHKFIKSKPNCIKKGGNKIEFCVLKYIIFYSQYSHANFFFAVKKNTTQSNNIGFISSSYTRIYFLVVLLL